MFNFLTVLSLYPSADHCLFFGWTIFITVIFDTIPDKSKFLSLEKVLL